MMKNTLGNNQDIRVNTNKLTTLREHFAGCYTLDRAFEVECFKEMLRDEIDLENKMQLLNGYWRI